MDNETIIAVTSIGVSGLLGFAGLILSLKQFWDSESVGRAARRSQALQMLSDEGFALQKVKAECRSLQILIQGHEEELGPQFERLSLEARRIVDEAKELLDVVQRKRLLHTGGTGCKGLMCERPSPELTPEAVQVSEAECATAYAAAMGRHKNYWK